VDIASIEINGYFCKDAQIWVVLPLRERVKSKWNNNIVVGYPGVDGIEFQIHPLELRIIAFYPITKEMVNIAENLLELVTKWQNDLIVL